MEIETKFKEKQKVIHIVQAYNLRTKEWHWIIENRKYIIESVCTYQDYGWKYILREPQVDCLSFVAFEQNLFTTKEQAQKECDRRNNEHNN